MGSLPVPSPGRWRGETKAGGQDAASLPHSHAPGKRSHMNPSRLPTRERSTYTKQLVSHLAVHPQIIAGPHFPLSEPCRNRSSETRRLSAGRPLKSICLLPPAAALALETCPFAGLTSGRANMKSSSSPGTRLLFSRRSQPPGDTNKVVGQGLSPWCRPGGRSRQSGALEAQSRLWPDLCETAAGMGPSQLLLLE